MSSAPALHKFFVYAPDKTEAGTFERRMSVRSQHLENAAKAISAGVIKVGGATLTPESLTGGDKKLTGSVLIFEAESLEAVRKMVESDVYYTSGVWNPETLVILPFAAATPFP